MKILADMRRKGPKVHTLSLVTVASLGLRVNVHSGVAVMFLGFKGCK
jgi:hypothetical protein